MALIAYVGMANFRELSKSDIGKYVDDYDGKKFRFERGVPEEVDDAVAEQLLEHEHFDGEFAAIDVKLKKNEDPETSEEVQDEVEKATKKAAKKADKKSQTGAPTSGQAAEDSPSAVDSTTSAPTSTGKGSSTTPGGTGSTR
jgi:divalent metal cation (Fe/Co/Zn/Cd) transporter